MTSKNLLEIAVPRVLLASTHAGSGLSTVTCGLLVALKKKGVSVAMGKIGPSLIDVTYHRRISGRLANSLDFWMLSRKDIHNSLGRLCGGAELVLIEGEKALFDYYGEDFCYRNLAEFAMDTKTPIILVMDGAGYRESLGAVVDGFNSFAADAKLAGVIVNRVADKEQGEILKRSVEVLGGVRFIGYLPLGNPALMSASEAQRENPSILTRSLVMAVGELAEDNVDLGILRELAATAGSIQVTAATIHGKTKNCKIAVADDAAFHLAFQDNIDLIRREGAEIISFSPIGDTKLPAGISGIYLPGGYVHLYANDLSSNQSLLKEIRSFGKAGGVVFAEGDAVAYLMESIILPSGGVYEGVGLIRGTATRVIEESASGFAYCDVESQATTVIGETGQRFRGIRNFQWLIRTRDEMPGSFKLRDRNLLLSTKRAEDFSTIEGLSPSPNILATAVRAHWGSNPKLSEIFVQRAASYLPHSAQ